MSNYYYQTMKQTAQHKSIISVITRRLLILFAPLAILLSSCSTSIKDIELVDAKLVDIKITGFTSAEVFAEAVINNPNNVSFKVKDVEGELFLKGKEFATFYMSEQVEIEKAVEKKYPIIILVSVSDPVAALPYVSDLSSIDFDDFTMDVRGKAKKMGVTIPVERKNVPLSKIITKMSGK